MAERDQRTMSSAGQWAAQVTTTDDMPGDWPSVIVAILLNPAVLTANDDSEHLSCNNTLPSTTPYSVLFRQQQATVVVRQCWCGWTAARGACQATECRCPLPPRVYWGQAVLGTVHELGVLYLPMRAMWASIACWPRKGWSSPGSCWSSAALAGC